jgi:hypothetical protein
VTISIFFIIFLINYTIQTFLGGVDLIPI